MENANITKKPSLFKNLFLKLKPIVINKVTIWTAKKAEIHRAKLTLMLSAPIVMAIEKEYEISELVTELFELAMSFVA